MKPFLLLLGFAIGFFLKPLLTNGQGPIYLGTPFNQDYNDGDTVYYPNCSFSVSTLTAHLNNGGSQVNPNNPTSLPGGWSASIPGGSNQVNYSISFGQDGDLVQPYSYPNGGGSQYTLHFKNPYQPIATFTSTPTLGANQTGTFTISGSKPYTYAYWDHEGQLTINSYTNSSASVSTGSHGGLLKVSLDNGLGCPYVTQSAGVGTPYIDHTTVNGSNGTMATVA